MKNKEGVDSVLLLDRFDSQLVITRKAELKSSA